jgi:dipeptidyl aminopeptidase/acylaminoacyl peptidase
MNTVAAARTASAAAASSVSAISFTATSSGTFIDPTAAPVFASRTDNSRRDRRLAHQCGGSAGGYTTLAALTFRDFFQGGASYYGVSDVAALARDTHKFESRYLDWLIGPYPQEEARYRERSPLYHADRLAKPVIFFQGDEDAVVPPNQAEAMVEALRRKGNPVGYFLFSGEQHGFRKAANIQRCLDAELAFYAIEVFRTGLTF